MQAAGNSGGKQHQSDNGNLLKQTPKFSLKQIYTQQYSLTE